MLKSKENPGALAGASGAQNLELITDAVYTSTARYLQAQRLAARFGLFPATAAVVVELAGIGGAQ